MHDIDRIHAMDNLRALAMLAGVVLVLLYFLLASVL